MDYNKLTRTHSATLMHIPALIHTSVDDGEIKPQVYLYVSLSEYDFIAKCHYVGIRGFHNYNTTYRYGRNYSNTINCARGGGFLLSVNNKHFSRMLSLPASPVEHLFVLIKINLTYILVGIVYFPPRSDITN